MANPYFDNSDPGQRFQPGTVADGEAVDEKFDAIATGLDETYKDTTRALKFPWEEGMPSQEFDATALQRRNRVLGFDADGNVDLVSGFFYRQDWQPDTDYFVNDVVRDPVTTNLYVSIVRQTSGAESDFGNTNKWYLAVDADTVRQERIAAEAARDLAEAWASQDPGPVNGTAYQSAKTYALDARGSEAAARGYRDEVAAAEANVETLEQSATDAEAAAQQHASDAGASAQAAADSATSVEGLETQAQQSADDAAASAQAAADSETEVKSIETRITDTTTMDFLNFELSGPDLIAHFDGYADDSKFSINAAGELEVIL